MIVVGDSLYKISQGMLTKRTGSHACVEAARVSMRRRACDVGANDEEALPPLPICCCTQSLTEHFVGWRSRGRKNEHDGRDENETTNAFTRKRRIEVRSSLLVAFVKVLPLRTCVVFMKGGLC